MDINQKAKEFAHHIKNTEEFKQMNKSKTDIDKNRALKKQLDSYVSKKKTIYSRNKIEDASKKISQLNRDYSSFFSLPVVAEYMENTRKFNSMMEKLYKNIENELIK